MVGNIVGPERAVVFSAAGRAEVVPVTPTPAGPDQVAGHTLVSLVSPGTELATYTDKLRSAFGDQAPETFPAFPGYAAVFRVEEVGAEVDGTKLGQLAFCWGGHRSWQCESAEMVLPVPDGLAPDEAVFARLAGVSMTTLVTTTARPPGPVLVSGLGPVGNLAAQVFQAAGYSVTAVDPAQRRVATAREAGIRDARAKLDPDLPAQFALAVECSGHEDAALQGCRLVSAGGEVVLVATPWQQRSEASAHALLRDIFFRYVHVRSGWEWELPISRETWRPGSVLGNQALALRWLAEKTLNVEGLGASVQPEDAQDAYDALLAQDGALTRLFVWQG